MFFPQFDRIGAGSGLDGIESGFVMTDMVGSRTLRSQWDETVRCYGREPFLESLSVDDRVSAWTYEEFDRRVKQAANFFLELGVARQELVALHLHNTPEYLVCWLALAQIGAVSVPLNEHYQKPEVQYILQKCGKIGRAHV